jgi:hypothetical protein
MDFVFYTARTLLDAGLGFGALFGRNGVLARAPCQARPRLLERPHLT